MLAKILGKINLFRQEKNAVYGQAHLAIWTTEEFQCPSMKSFGFFRRNVVLRIEWSPVKLLVFEVCDDGRSPVAVLPDLV
jgi:hypothetical protein